MFVESTKIKKLQDVIVWRSITGRMSDYYLVKGRARVFGYWLNMARVEGKRLSDIEKREVKGVYKQTFAEEWKIVKRTQALGTGEE